MSTIIWIDASFAIEWLLATDRAKTVTLPSSDLYILSAQYAEILVYFHKRLDDLAPVTRELKMLELYQPDRSILESASIRYVDAKRTSKKISLSDAILAAAAQKTKAPIATFDHDFITLGFTQRGDGLMVPS